MSIVRVRVLGADGHPLAERVYSQFPFSIGRDPTCHLVLGDVNCSRKHAMVELRDGQLSYTDVGSSMGSFLRTGERITSAALGTGSLVRIGAMWLEFSYESNVRTTAPARNDDSRWDKNVRSVPLILAMVLAVGVSFGGLSYETTIGSALDVFAMLFTCSLSALILSALTYGVSRLFRRDPSYASIFFSYWLICALVLVVNAINQYSESVYPDDHRAGTFVMLLATIPIFGLFFQHFRWVFGAPAKWPRRGFRTFAALIILLAAFNFVGKPRSGSVTSEASLAMPIMRAPASSYVGTEQLVHDIEASLSAVTRPSNGRAAD